MSKGFLVWMLLAMSVLAVTFAGCSAAGSPTAVPPTQSTVKLSLTPVVASTDLSLGNNRIVFAILDSSSKPVTEAEVQVTFLFLGGSNPEQRPAISAQFQKWPTSQTGVYTTQADFDKTGQWGIEVSLKSANGENRVGRGVFQVKSKSSTPAIGADAIKSKNKTAKDVSSLDELTSDPQPDKDLYQLTIAAAVASAKPTLITFASPAFCTTGTCGPQVDVIKELKNKYLGQADFIHVEIYANPSEIQGDLSKGRLSPTVGEWGLTSEPWTFLVNSDGKIASKFEGFATSQELETALKQTLGH